MEYPAIPVYCLVLLDLAARFERWPSSRAGPR
jgi:hypothetical protein